VTRNTRIMVVDSDSRRRATVSYTMSKHDVHVEPFETADDLSLITSECSIVLAFDYEGVVSELLACMRATGTWLPIVVYAPDAPIPRVVDAMLNGASDFLVWPLDPKTILGAIERVSGSRQKWQDLEIAQAKARKQLESLTKRESEVLIEVSNGLSNRRIGEKLAISPRTVEIHRANMMNKLGVERTPQAVRLAFEAAVLS
jgi:two-component system response regulator FixJ